MTIFVDNAGDDLLITVPGAAANLEGGFDELTPEQQLQFAKDVVAHGTLAGDDSASDESHTVRTRGRDARHVRVADGAHFAAAAERCNPTLAGGRAPGANYDREERRQAARNTRLQAFYDSEGRGQEGGE